MREFLQKIFSARLSAPIAVCLGLCMAIAGCSTPSKIEPDFVAERWSTTLKAFNIDPIFLPRQVQLGDVYLTEEIAGQGVHDANLWKRRTMYLGRAAVQQAVEQDTRTRLRLPLTSESSPTGNIFQPPATTTALRPVAFPGFNVSEIRESDLAAAFPFNLFRAIFGASRNSELLMSINIPSAEYEEVPALVAWDKFAEFCWHENEEPICAESNPVLRHLVNNLGLPGETAVLIPKIGIVTSVYYARQINYFYNTGRASAFGAVVSRAQANAQEKDATTTATAATGDSGDAKGNASNISSASADNIALNKKIQELQARIDALQNDTQGANKYGSIRVVSISNSGTILNQTFERPVAIGYRALWIYPLGYRPPSSTVLQQEK